MRIARPARADHALPPRFPRFKCGPREHSEGGKRRLQASQQWFVNCQWSIPGPAGEETVLALLGAAATAFTPRLRSRTGNLVVSEKRPNRGHNGLPEIV